MSKLIYVADDEKNICFLIENFLEKEGYEVECFGDGESLLEAFEKKAPDLCILDIMMPGMDGPEVFRRMQEDERTQGIPVFFMTAVTDRDRVLECMEMNPEEYLVKPVSSSKLLKKLSDLFEKES